MALKILLPLSAFLAGVTVGLITGLRLSPRQQPYNYETSHSQVIDWDKTLEDLMSDRGSDE